MSYYRQENRRSRLSVGQDGNALTTLIAINLIVFVLVALIKLIYYFTFDNNVEGLAMFKKNILHWITLPADLSQLVKRPWTLLTHMFVHEGVWHIIGNMIWLWIFGSILQNLAGNRKLAPVFLYGGLAGALAYILTYNVIPVLNNDIVGAEALGASAGVMAIAIATTVIAPGYRFFPMLNGGIPLWVITMIFVIIDLATIPYNNPGGHIAHLAGAGMGFLFMFLSSKGYDPGKWMHSVADWVNNLFNPEKPKKGKNIKTELFYKSKTTPYKKTSTFNQQKIDELLEKIHQKGFNSLSQEEKELLKRASKEDL